MKQGPARKAFYLWFVSGIILSQFFSDAEVDRRKVPSVGGEESWLGKPVICMSQCLSEIQFFQLSHNKVRHSFLNTA